MSNAQWHSDQSAGEAAMAKIEQIKGAERSVVAAAVAFRRAIKNGSRRDIDRTEDALDAASDALVALLDASG